MILFEIQSSDMHEPSNFLVFSVFHLLQKMGQDFETHVTVVRCLDSVFLIGNHKCEIS